MDYPRGVDGFTFAVEDIEYHSADKESEDDKSLEPYRVPTYHHRDVVERKADRAEDACPF